MSRLGISDSLYYTIFALLWLFSKLPVLPLPGQRHIDSMTTTKGLFDRFVDRLDFLVMGDRSKARTSDAVLNIVTAAGFVSLLPTLRPSSILIY